MARFIFLIALVFFATSSFAQIRDIPKEVMDNFETQYPTAEKAEFKDNLVNVQVSFMLDGESMLATYSNKGIWKNTEKEWSYDKLSDDIKTGFEKSKYADWKVVETKIIYQPGGTERYRIKAEKNDVNKRNLYFNKSGRLTDEDITL